MTISCFISLKSLDFDDEDGKINSTLAILFSIFLFSFPLYSTIFAILYKQKLSDKNIWRKFESFFLNIDLKKKYSNLTTPIFLLRRLTFAITVIFFNNNTMIQFFIHFPASIFTLCFFMTVKPMKS